jgi:hypothetical protein
MAVFIVTFVAEILTFPALYKQWEEHEKKGGIVETALAGRMSRVSEIGLASGEGEDEEGDCINSS